MRGSILLPKQIIIYSNKEGEHGAMVSNIDKKDIKSKKSYHALSRELKHANDKFTSHAIKHSNSSKLNNDPYKPKIKKGFNRTTNRRHSLVFLAPDGKTWLPLLAEHFQSLMLTSTISKGTVQDDCVIVKNDGHYFPMPLDSEVVKEATNFSLDPESYTSTAHLNENDIVLRGNTRYKYLGLYTQIQMPGLNKRQRRRMHILQDMSSLQFSARTSLTKSLVLLEKAKDTDKPHDYSEELTRKKVDAQYSYSMFYAKNAADAQLYKDNIVWKPSSSRDSVKDLLNSRYFNEICTWSESSQCFLSITRSLSGYSPWTSRSSGNKYNVLKFKNPGIQIPNTLVEGVDTDFLKNEYGLTVNSIKTYSPRVIINNREIELSPFAPYTASVK